MRGGRPRHGHSPEGAFSPTYQSWRAMKARCQNSKDHKYHRYGGRGIEVCAAWQTFDNFLADMGERPEGMFLERKDNARGYEPGNCRWATRHDQLRNREVNVWITIGDRTQCVADWCKETGVPSPLAYVRHTRLGWSWERALTQPVKKRIKL